MMKLLKLHQQVINEFNRKNILNKSETKLGLLYWLTDDEKEMVKSFEREHDVLVYHIIKTKTVDFDYIYDLLYVTDDAEYMQNAIEALKSNYVLSYSITPFPENGIISVEKMNDGLIRKF